MHEPVRGMLGSHSLLGCSFAWRGEAAVVVGVVIANVGPDGDAAVALCN